ncbi:MAG: hypothetical protein MHM6MM_005547 [Cercozoa sp. M6MM]
MKLLLSAVCVGFGSLAQSASYGTTYGQTVDVDRVLAQVQQKTFELGKHVDFAEKAVFEEMSKLSAVVADLRKRTDRVTRDVMKYD